MSALIVGNFVRVKEKRTELSSNVGPRIRFSVLDNLLTHGKELLKQEKFGSAQDCLEYHGLNMKVTTKFQEKVKKKITYHQEQLNF